jgi:hypothetical protein
MKYTWESTAIINFGQSRYHRSLLIGGEAWLHIISGKVINFGWPKTGDIVPKSNL